MSATAQTGGSANDRTTDQIPTPAGRSSVLWIVLLALVFAMAVGGSYVLIRGRIGATATQSKPAPTAIPIATPANASSAPTAVPVPAGVAGASTPSAQPTLSADQAASSYLWQQSHEQDFCSCNTANPPSSP